MIVSVAHHEVQMCTFFNKGLFSAKGIIIK